MNLVNRALSELMEQRLLELYKRNNLNGEGIMLPYTIALCDREMIQKYNLEEDRKGVAQFKVNQKGIEYLQSKKLI